MGGRPKKHYTPLYRDVYLQTKSSLPYYLTTLPVLCPVCGSAQVGEFGTRKRKNGRVEYFQCKNPDCPFLRDHAYGKQFSLSGSYAFKRDARALLVDIYTDLLGEGAKNKTIAAKYHVSPALISGLRSDLEDTLEATQGLEHLLTDALPERAVAIDETFLKVAGKTVYIIIATGYDTHKTLGLKVSETRKESDLREVFEEARANSSERIELISADAWGATQTMVKNLKENITLVIHKHKKPYDKAVLRTFRYTDSERIITEVGVKTDVFKRRGKREYHYREWREPLSNPTPKPRGRPRGVKNGRGKKKKTTRKKGKRGRKGLFTVFTRGKRGYMKVDPYRGKIKLRQGCLEGVRTALNTGFSIYCRKSIQNNVAENINSVLHSMIRLKGPKTIESVERRLRALLIVRNTPSILESIEVERNFHKDVLYRQFKTPFLTRMMEMGLNLRSMQKKEVSVNF